MKNFTIFFLFFVSGFLSAKLFSQELAEKTYICPGQVDIESNKIIIFQDDFILPVSALRHDEQGLYFLSAEVKPIESPRSWVCRLCGFDNDFWRDRCLDCDHRRQ